MIEDIRSVALPREATLKRLGHEVKLANTLAKAVALYNLNQRKLGIITFDFSLPDGNTLELIATAAEDQAGRDCSLLLVAASSFETGRHQQLNAGCNDAIDGVASYVEDIDAMAAAFSPDTSFVCRSA